MNKIILALLIYYFNIGFSQDIDTLRVNQQDSTYFTAKHVPTRPCSKSRLEFYYELKDLKDSTYYFVYNNEKQLIEEGMYTSNYLLQGNEYNGFYNSTYYRYFKNGRLSTIYYQKDGRNVVAEYYKRGKLKKVAHY